MDGQSMKYNVGKQCILVIDDEPLNIQTLSRMLLPEYDVRVARDGTAGLIMAQQYRPDLILLDVVMDGLSGFEVLEKLQQMEETQKIPVIFITSMDTQDSEVKGLSLGAVDYITKPFIQVIVKLRVATHLKIQSQMRIIERFGLVDALTELNNRRSFDQQLGYEWSRSKRDGNPLSLLMVDIDKFKNFNDTYGHASGDLVLKAVARSLRSTVKRGTDNVYRLGGEEFVILLPQTDKAGAEVVAETVRSNVEKMRTACVDGTIVKVTISVGAGTIIPNTSDNAADFLHMVDGALYKAKENGRNRVEFLEN